MEYHRRSIRLGGYDYSKNGYYFITVDTWAKRRLFGELIGGEMILNQNGMILKNEIENTPKMRPGVQIHTMQIMPDHWHAIVYIPEVGANCNSPVHKNISPQQKNRTQNISNIVAGIKMAVSKKLKINGIKLQIWQRNYWERIIRDDEELERVRKYIKDNPKVMTS